MRTPAFVFFLLFLSASTGWAKSGMIIQKVIDGETIELSDGRRVHLIGIKTSHVQPILTNRFKLSMEKIAALDLTQLAQGAAAYIENHAVGKTVRLSFDPANEKRGHKDPEGRTLAYIWYVSYAQGSREGEGTEKIFGVKSQDRLLNQELIMMGHGLVDTSMPFLQQEEFLSTEKSAAKALVGFWRSAADIYGALLSQAKGAQFVSTAGFVTKDSQKTSLEASRKAFAELIKLNPKDFRPYYERSWLGANPVHDKVKPENLTDIDEAIARSAFNPKCYMQKSYLMALSGHFSEASLAYTKMTSVAGKMGMSSLVTEMSLEKTHEPEWAALKKMLKTPDFLTDALRATLNEDHFLLFMARYKNFGETVPKEIEDVYEKVSKTGRFPSFMKKHEAFLMSATPHAAIFRTQWALRGHEMPEDVMRWMETIGEVTVVSNPQDDKDAIDMTGRDDTGPQKKKKKTDASQSDTQFS